MSDNNNNNELLLRLLKSALVGFTFGVIKEYTERDRTTDVHKVANIATKTGLTILSGIIADHFDKSPDAPTTYILGINQPLGGTTARFAGSMISDLFRLHKSFELYLFRGYLIEHPNNLFYAYILIPDKKVHSFHEARKKGPVALGDFGEILVAGKGEPPPELVKRMQERKSSLEK